MGGGSVRLAIRVPLKEEHRQHEVRSRCLRRCGSFAHGVWRPSHRHQPVYRSRRRTNATSAGLLLGTVKKCTDQAPDADHHRVSLPNQPITVVHPSDGPGPTCIITDYLSNVSADWKSGPGKGKSVNWQVGQRAKGTEAVA